jgi:hypothetical protein
MGKDWWGIGPSTLAQWAGAAVTFAAVLVALFKDSIRDWLRKPKLTVTCTKEIPETVRVPISVLVQAPGQAPGQALVAWSGNCYFVRIKVENEGRTRAEKIQVSALKLAKRGLDNTFVDLPTTLPFNMKWSNYPPTAPVTVLDGISRKMWAFCDIVSLCDPANTYQRRPTNTPATETVGQLQLEFDLPDEWHLLARGTYRLTLRIAAANASPICKIVEFTHDGTWTQDDVAMRRDHLVVSLRQS